MGRPGKVGSPFMGFDDGTMGRTTKWDRTGTEQGTLPVKYNSSSKSLNISSRVEGGD
jgi:hypothetical protein